MACVYSAVACTLAHFPTRCTFLLPFRRSFTTYVAERPGSSDRAVADKRFFNCLYLTCSFIVEHWKMGIILIFDDLELETIHNIYLVMLVGTYEISL